MTSETKETVTVTLDREKTSLAVETLEGFALDAMSPARRKAIIDTAALLGMALDQETKEPQQTTEDGTPQLPFLYGREQGDGSFKDALDNLLADLRGLLFAANPGQQVVIDREHIDRDGFYFTARTLPYLTEVQFKAAAASKGEDIR